MSIIPPIPLVNKHLEPRQSVQPKQNNVVSVMNI